MFKSSVFIITAENMKIYPGGSRVPGLWKLGGGKCNVFSLTISDKDIGFF